MNAKASRDNNKEEEEQWMDMCEQQTGVNENSHPWDKKTEEQFFNGASEQDKRQLEDGQDAPPLEVHLLSFVHWNNIHFEVFW